MANALCTEFWWHSTWTGNERSCDLQWRFNEIVGRFKFFAHHFKMTMTDVDFIKLSNWKSMKKYTVIFPVLDRFSILVPYVPQKRYIWISFVVIYKTLSYQQIYSEQTFFRFQTCLHRWKCKHVWFSQFWMIFPVPDGFLKDAQNGFKGQKMSILQDIYFFIFIHLNYLYSRSVNDLLSYLFSAYMCSVSSMNEVMHGWVVLLWRKPCYL